MSIRSNKRKVVASNWKIFGGLTENTLSIPRIDQTNTSYTLSITNNNHIIYADNTGPNTITVPSNSIAPFPIGAKIDVVKIGIGGTTIQAGSGVTINSADSALEIGSRYGAVTLVKTDINTWLLIGNLS
jgi:hypothetical protein